MRSSPVLGGGCEPGHVVAFSAERVPAIGIDLSPLIRAHVVPARAGEMAALSFRSHSVEALFCALAAIHLDAARHAWADGEFKRVRWVGGRALVAFPVSVAQTQPGQEKRGRAG
jgi:hypothetical protein